MGAILAKSKTVHSFDELSQCGFQELIDDIIAVYHYYCTGSIDLPYSLNKVIDWICERGVL